jgi:HEAT repeat protein
MTRPTLLLVGLLIASPTAAAQNAPGMPPAPPPRPALPAPAPAAAPGPASGERLRDNATADAAVRDLTQRLQTLRQVALMRDTVRQAVTLTGLAGTSDYDRGLGALQQHQYDRAVTSFDRVIAGKGTRTDGALYWKAYAQSRLARPDDALATLGVLKRDFPQSRYLADGRVLEADLAKSAGRPIDPQALDANDEIRLYAISGIAHTDPDRAIPLLESVLSESNALGVKKRAIYVLALSSDPRAHTLLLRYAKGAGNPDLQMEAIRYLATRRDATTTGAELKDIYQTTTDKDVRRAIIDAYRAGPDTPFPMTVRVASPTGATSATVERLAARASADRRGERTAAGDDRAAELWALYTAETDADLRGQMANVFMTMGATDRVMQMAKTDANAGVRTRAIRSLGRAPIAGAPDVAQTLVGLYDTQQDAETRRAVIDALGGQRNADALVTIARKETDLALKTAIVRRLSELAPGSKTATDYLMEVIK